MFEWYLEIRSVVSETRKKSFDALRLLENESEENEAAARKVNEYLKSDYKRLSDLWQKHLGTTVPTYLARHIGFGMRHDYEDILNTDLPGIENSLDKALAERGKAKGELGFEHLLHPVIAKHCYDSFRLGHLRDAVLNAFVAVFDLIRARTGIDADGANLVNKVFSLTQPYLVLSELESESGQNDQKGFIQIYSGSYLGIRNPKAHTLTHDLTELKAAQYLIFASLLARRIDESAVRKSDKKTDAKKRIVGDPHLTILTGGD